MKRKGIKRIIILLLTVCIAVFSMGALSGCSSDKDDTEDGWTGFF